MNGKSKCKILKEIRQKIADENDIPYVTRECSYQGACRGTCPQCEAELQYLERELEKRKKLGKAVAVAAVASGLSLSLAACTPKGTDLNPEGMGITTESKTSASTVLATEAPSVPPEETVEILEGELEPEPPETEDVEELAGDIVLLPEEFETETVPSLTPGDGEN